MNIEDKYDAMCVDALKERFKIKDGIYKDPKFIEDSLKFCRDIIISEFEKEATRIVSFNLVCNNLADYSFISVNQPTLLDEKLKHTLYVIKRKQYKYLFSEIVKFKLHNDQSNTDNTLRINLLYLTNILHMISENLYMFYINNNSGMQLILENKNFEYKFFDNSFNLKKKQIIEITTFDFFKGKIGGQELIDKFLDTATSAFGDVVNNFRDVVFEEFIKLTNSKQEIRKRLPDEVVDISGLYYNFPNNPFLQGLTLKGDSVSLLTNFTHPHKAYRSRYRPILELNIDGNPRYITTPYLVFEALGEHITNQIPFGNLPEEWQVNKMMTNYSSKQRDEHDKWLDDLVENVLVDNNLIFLRNKKSIDGMSLNEQPSSIDGMNVGEIDFIIVDIKQKMISVVDCKHLKTKYDFANFGDDKSKFVKGKDPYEPRLSIKHKWVYNNLVRVQNEINRLYCSRYDILDFNVDLYFITNAPSFYSFFSKYPIIPISQLKLKLDGVK